MEKDRYDRLTAAGIQVEEALGRFMNNEMLFNRFLEKFADDANFIGSPEDYGRGRRQRRFRGRSHFKGGGWESLP